MNFSAKDSHVLLLPGHQELRLKGETLYHHTLLKSCFSSLLVVCIGRVMYAQHKPTVCMKLYTCPEVIASVFARDLQGYLNWPLIINVITLF